MVGVMKTKFIRISRDIRAIRLFRVFRLFRVLRVFRRRILHLWPNLRSMKAILVSFFAMQPMEETQWSNLRPINAMLVSRL